MRRTHLNRADFAGSTKRSLKYTVESPANEFIVATEEGIIYQMQKASPGKKFIPLPHQMQIVQHVMNAHMKLNTMELYLCMKKMADLKYT